MKYMEPTADPMTGSLTDKVKEKIDTPDARRVPIARGWEL